MSLNIGTLACEAAKSLRQSSDWTTLRSELGRIMQDKLYAAVEAPPEARLDATAYARALRDLWTALEAATLELNPRQVERAKPLIPGRG